MPRTPIGETAMTDAERSRRKREKAKALRDAALMPDVVAVEANGSEPMAAITTRPEAPVTMSGDYPRMLYHPDGRTTIAATPEANDQLMVDGWGTVPLAVHRQCPVTSHGILGATSDPMVVMIKEAFREAVREMLDEYDLSPEAIQEMSDESPSPGSGRQRPVPPGNEGIS